jgi:hypothetical protein
MLDGSLSFLTSPACGGGRRATGAFTRVSDALWRVGRGQFDIIVQSSAPSPTLPRKRGREKKASAS